jgi:N-acetylneuraminate synthase
MTESISFGSRRIGADVPPLVIAELSGNHNGSLERALALVDAAATAGAHAVKLQTYTPDTMTLDIADGDFVIDDPTSLWYGRTLYDLYGEASTPWEWHEALFARAREHGIECFSTPFDESAIEYLERFDPPGYKIASFEVTDLRLIGVAARTGRPMILSTGMATLREIDEAVRTARDAGASDVVLLQCTSTYPASPENSHVRTIPNMRETFGCEIGLSDHTGGIGVAVAAVALGAVMIEKHVTLSRADGGVDSAFSLEPAELRSLVVETERAWQSLGEVRYGPTHAERASLRFRRSIYVSEDVRAGEELGRNNVRVVRPGFGLAPKHFTSVLGRRAKSDIARGTALRWDLLA